MCGFPLPRQRQIDNVKFCVHPPIRGLDNGVYGMEGIGSSFGLGGPGGTASLFAGVLHTDVTASAFADEVARRAVPDTAVSASIAAGDTISLSAEALSLAGQQSPASGGEGTGGDARREQLAASLEDAMRHVADAHGDRAATAFMGLVMKRLGDGSVSEESLGNGLLDGLRFIDRQFGTAAGDSLIARFNGGLNDSINGFFGNGHDELFLASTTMVGQGGASVTGGVLPTLSPAGGGTEGGDLLKQMLEDLKNLRLSGVDETGTGAAAAASGNADSIVSSANPVAIQSANSGALKTPFAAYASPSPSSSGLLLDMSV